MATLLADQPLLSSFDTSACGSTSVVPDPFVSTSGAAHDLAPRELVPSRLLLMTHSRLLWFDVESLSTSLLLEVAAARQHTARRESTRTDPHHPSSPARSATRASVAPLPLTTADLSSPSPRPAPARPSASRSSLRCARVVGG